MEKQSREPSGASILLQLEGHLLGSPGPASQNISDRHSLLRAGCRGALNMDRNSAASLGNLFSVALQHLAGSRAPFGC